MSEKENNFKEFKENVSNKLKNINLPEGKEIVDGTVEIARQVVKTVKGSPKAALSRSKKIVNKVVEVAVKTKDAVKEDNKE